MCMFHVSLSSSKDELQRLYVSCTKQDVALNNLLQRSKNLVFLDFSSCGIGFCPFVVKPPAWLCPSTLRNIKGGPAAKAKGKAAPKTPAAPAAKPAAKQKADTDKRPTKKAKK